MNARAKKVREEVLELPKKAEDEHFGSVEEIERAWAAEIERRIQDVKEGRVRLIPAEQALRDVRASLKRARTRRAR